MAARKWLSIALVLLIVAAWLIIFSTDEPRLPATSADGTYYNSCCASLTLRGGELRSGIKTVAYTVEQDKIGAYVLPKAFVSVANNRLDIDRRAYPLKLRLDRERNPSSIEVVDRSDAPPHAFVRRYVR